MAKTTTNDLSAMRATIAALQAERAKLHGNVRDRADARAEISAYVAQAAEPISARLRYAAATGITPDLLIARPRADGAVDLGPVLAALLGPDLLAAALAAHIEQLPPESDRAERAARLAEITAELDRLENAEEIEVVRLERQGLTVQRRADARPEIVLAIRN